ncbi:hypothetical protein BRADI_1g23532v3 [Brachypodium distachyon]|uniref:Uncharacterized protein n=1 Tax=Brachypodium distachyon TaxID=15368 RepID=A0A2K2DKS3_BRADI|nr:hypothetical protein BRADI_1g23532v3 [Brachypodium distachyon]
MPRRPLGRDSASPLSSSRPLLPPPSLSLYFFFSEPPRCWKSAQVQALSLWQATTIPARCTSTKCPSKSVSSTTLVKLHTHELETDSNLILSLHARLIFPKSGEAPPPAVQPLQPLPRLAAACGRIGSPWWSKRRARLGLPRPQAPPRRRPPLTVGPRRRQLPPLPPGRS